MPEQQVGVGDQSNEEERYTEHSDDERGGVSVVVLARPLDDGETVLYTRR